MSSVEEKNGDPARSAAIRLEDVAVELGGSTVLHGVDLEIARETTVALVGPSGSGKSTILRLLVGLVKPRRGRITIEGEPITGATLPAMRKKIGYVVQEGALFPHLTAAENCTLLAREIGWSEDRRRARLVELGDLVGLPADAVARFPAELSGGQRQRVGIMRALFLDPALLLFDEPLGALDPVVRQRLRRDLRSIFRRLKKTVILVTHDAADAERLADEIAVLHEGRIVQRGTPESLRQAPATAVVASLLRPEQEDAT
jgi:osmoprotectant transport system ATP-binding protein